MEQLKGLGWQGWTVILTLITICMGAGLTIGQWNGESAAVVKKMEHFIDDHAKACVETQKAIQQLAISINNNTVKLEVLWSERRKAQ